MTFYESIKDLPNARKMLAQKYALWGSGVGNHIDNVRDNIIQAHAFFASDKKKDGMVFLQNAELGIEAIYSEESFEAKELACYVKNEDMGIPMSEKQVEEIANEINMTMTSDEIEQTLERIKKKVDTELRIYFPHKYDEEVDMNKAESYKTMLIREAEYLINPNEETEQKLKVARSYYLDFHKPNIFNPFDEENMITSLELNYEKMMISFEENGVNARGYTVFQFEVAIKKNEDDISNLRRNEN